ncbi:FAD dependent oxidoreductase [Pluteus cervinus]|uniref:FAD dependent oxidoreductase n=1 Tax=Pluteus cervinus TaxID=181527 RepID=A0ACD3APT2_9AGAR|nr:FAD dependent oxidoreductase [Pluteus cervinus]
MSTVSRPTNIVIIGGGIIGCTTAYYLSHHLSYTAEETRITVIEASIHGPAQGASGKAGGLVAKWAYPKELASIAFAEHVKLAEKHDGENRWGWRYVGCGSWEGNGDEPGSQEASERAEGIKGGKSLEKTVGLEEYEKPVREAARRSKGLPDDLLWVKEGLTDNYSPMAKPGDTAQVHPYLFTTSMATLAKEEGVRFVRGKALSIHYGEGRVTGVEYEDKTSVDRLKQLITASHVVLAAGAWSPQLLASLPIEATRAHSVTILPRPGVAIAPYVLFTEISVPLPRGGRIKASPEIYARPDGEVYACGPGDDSPLPDCVDEVEVSEAACNTVYEHVASISKELKEGEITKRQACFLPTVSTGGGPIVGEAVQLAKGLVIATGHTCWGICNAPGTALAVSELIMEGQIRCGNLRSLYPARFL